MSIFGKPKKLFEKHEIFILCSQTVFSFSIWLHNFFLLFCEKDLGIKYVSNI